VGVARTEFGRDARGFLPRLAPAYTGPDNEQHRHVGRGQCRTGQCGFQPRREKLRERDGRERRSFSALNATPHLFLKARGQ
jgi:hypothetical protein